MKPILQFVVALLMLPFILLGFVAQVAYGGFMAGFGASENTCIEIFRD